MNALIPGETLPQFLNRRRQELEAQISALRGELLPRETELAQINKMCGLLSTSPQSGLSALALDAAVSDLQRAEKMVEEGNAIIEYAGTVTRVPATLPFSGLATSLTIKQMILWALRDHFREGATPTDLRDYMKAAYGRDIDRNSISPQLARLREQGVVEHDAGGISGESKWKLTRGGKLYNHPTSWKVAEKDEPPDPNAPNTRLGDTHASPTQFTGVRVRGAVLRTKKKDDFLD